MAKVVVVEDAEAEEAPGMPDGPGAGAGAGGAGAPQGGM